MQQHPAVCVSAWPDCSSLVSRKLAQFNLHSSTIICIWHSSLWLSLTQQKTRKFLVTLLPTFPHILALSASASSSACHCHCHCLNHPTNPSFLHFHCLISLPLIGCMLFIAFFFSTLLIFFYRFYLVHIVFFPGSFWSYLLSSSVSISFLISFSLFWPL